MNATNNIIVCKSIKYYSRKDEDAFFEWMQKINCIDKVEGAGEELHLYIASDNLHDSDLRDLIALFYRYSLDMKLLKRFLNDNNRVWFFDNKQAYWHKCIF